MTPDDDPGWPRGISILALLVPGMMQRQARRTGDALVMLRYVMLSFTFGLVMIGVVIVFIRTTDNALVPWLPALAAIAVVVPVAGRIAEKPLDCTSDATLSATYRTRFFLRIAFAETVALFGFVFVFIGAAKWIYAVGAAVTLYRFWTSAAPTRAALARDQEQLNAAGCTRSLVAALRSPPPSR